MADPVVSYFKSDDITELNSLNPEDFGEVIMGNSSAAQEIHIWNDKGGRVFLVGVANRRI